MTVPKSIPKEPDFIAQPAKHHHHHHNFLNNNVAEGENSNVLYDTFSVVLVRCSDVAVRISSQLTFIFHPDIAQVVGHILRSDELQIFHDCVRQYVPAVVPHCIQDLHTIPVSYTCNVQYLKET